MKVNKKLVVLAVPLIIIISVALGAVLLLKPETQNTAADLIGPQTCTQEDRENNNCVPPGRCIPPGHPMARYERMTECQTTNYEHKFNIENL